MSSTIADKLSLLANTKKDIRQAIIDKGGTVDADPFSAYAQAIAAIPAKGSSTYKAMLVMESIVNSTETRDEDAIVSSVQEVLTQI